MNAEDKLAILEMAVRRGLALDALMLKKRGGHHVAQANYFILSDADCYQVTQEARAQWDLVRRLVGYDALTILDMPVIVDKNLPDDVVMIGQRAFRINTDEDKKP
jgi:hypothetical protein